jgi:hypothetical protein
LPDAVADADAPDDAAAGAGAAAVGRPYPWQALTAVTPRTAAAPCRTGRRARPDCVAAGSEVEDMAGSLAEREGE